MAEGMISKLLFWYFRVTHRVPSPEEIESLIKVPGTYRGYLRTHRVAILYAGMKDVGQVAKALGLTPHRVVVYLWMFHRRSKVDYLRLLA